MFIGRKPDNSIYGCWTVKQWDGQEELPADHPDLVAFLAPKPPDPRRVLDDAECEAAKIDGQIVAFLNMTPAQLDTWVDANITGAGPRTAFKILGRLAQNAARGKALR